jgi:hypothetical protein
VRITTASVLSDLTLNICYVSRTVTVETQEMLHTEFVSMFLQRHLLQLAVSSCHKPQAEAHF